MKTESISHSRHRAMRILDIINNIVTFINAIGIAFLAFSLLNMQDQIRTLFNRDGDTAIKVAAIEKTLDAREKLFADHVAWSSKHMKSKPATTNLVDNTTSLGGNR